MQNTSLVKLLVPSPPGSSPNAETPLWLLHHDDSRFLYLSFLLSAIAHLLLFLVLVTTKIFQPQIGSSLNFHMVWLAPGGEAASAAAKPSRQGPPMTVQPGSAARSRRAGPGIKPSTTSAEAKSSPAIEHFRPETEGQTAVALFGGKVVEVIDRDNPAPTFTIISSVLQKSPGSTAVVSTIREAATETRQVPERTEAAPQQTPAPGTVPAVTVVRLENGGKSGRTLNSTAPPTTSGTSAAMNSVKPVSTAGNGSTAARGPAPASGAPAAAATEASGSTGSAAVAGPPSVQPPGGKAAVASSNGTGQTTATPGSTPKTVAPAVSPKEEVQSPPPASQPQTSFQPALFGDLKLVITAENDAVVEGTFREFRKARRHKPLTRWESENKRRMVVFTVARVRLDTREAVIGRAEEGIYDILVSSADGKPLRGQFTLKINEYGNGGKAIPLGTRTINGTRVIARVLMPEGILWEDEASFTGSMEDSDSITRFDANSGLVWREYR